MFFAANGFIPAGSRMQPVPIVCRRQQHVRTGRPGTDLFGIAQRREAGDRQRFDSCPLKEAVDGAVFLHGWFSGEKRGGVRQVTVQLEPAVL